MCEYSLHRICVDAIVTDGFCRSLTEWVYKHVWPNSTHTPLSLLSQEGRRVAKATKYLPYEESQVQVPIQRENFSENNRPTSPSSPLSYLSFFFAHFPNLVVLHWFEKFHNDLYWLLYSLIYIRLWPEWLNPYLIGSALTNKIEEKEGGTFLK